MITAPDPSVNLWLRPGCD